MYNLKQLKNEYATIFDLKQQENESRKKDDLKQLKSESTTVSTLSTARINLEQCIMLRRDLEQFKDKFETMRDLLF
jgi:hypothetical protein